VLLLATGWRAWMSYDIFLSFLFSSFFFLKKNKKNPGFDFVLNYSSYHQAKTDILKKKGPRENGTGLDGTS
jgi:hypothetical protein